MRRGLTHGFLWDGLLGGRRRGRGRWRRCGLLDRLLRDFLHGRGRGLRGGRVRRRARGGRVAPDVAGTPTSLAAVVRGPVTGEVAQQPGDATARSPAPVARRSTNSGSGSRTASM